MVMKISRPKVPTTGTLLTNAASVSPTWRIPNRQDTREFEPQYPPAPTLSLDCEIFSLSPGGAAQFALMDSWTLGEAALLLSGANPVLINEFDADPSIYKPDFGTCGYPAIRMLLVRAFESGALVHPCKPHDIVAWAVGKGLKVPAPLLVLAPLVTGQAMGDGPALRPTASAWSLITSLGRTPGYRWPLYQFLQAAHIAGKPCPKAQDVLVAWQLNPPAGVRVIQSGRRDELEYELTHGGKKTADLRAIQTAISGLVV
jgi:hypothetical protein